jgi:hypothetical protein
MDTEFLSTVLSSRNNIHNLTSLEESFHDS